MTMHDHEIATSSALKRTPWNKGKLTGAKPPLRPKHVWSISTRLQVEGRTRDLALFNLAIDSKLRGCDVVALKVEDVAPNGYSLDRATVRQKKTGRAVKFELTELTRQAVDDYLRASGKKPGEFLFSGRRGPGRSMTTRQYARLVSEWIADIGLDPHLSAPIHFGEPRRRSFTDVQAIYERCKFSWATPRSKAQSGIWAIGDALAIAEQVDV
jgi:integrase